MENQPSSHNPETPDEKMRRIIERYEKDLVPTVENGLLIRDISDVMMEYPQVLTAAQERFFSLYGIVDSDDPDFRQMLAGALQDKMSQHYDMLCGANVRLGGSMLALKTLSPSEGGGLRYYQSDPVEHIEGEILGMSSAELPRREIISMLIDVADILHDADTLQVPKELQMCMKIQNAATVDINDRTRRVEIGEVIVPLYVDAIELSRIDLVGPLDDNA